MPWYTVTEPDRWDANECLLWDGLDFEQNSLLQAVEFKREVSVGLFETAINSIDGLASIGSYKEIATFSLLELGIVIQIKYGLFLTKTRYKATIH